MTWYAWTSDNCTSAGTSSTWENWTSNYPYEITSTSNSTWTKWNDSTTDGNYYTTSPITNTWEQWTYIQTEVISQKALSKEELKAMEEKRKEYEQERIRMEELARKRREEEGARQKAAEEKALQLLLENLTENQAEVFKLTGAIPVQGISGKKYHIRKGISQNVHELDEKGVGTKCRLCFHPTDCPVYDVMLAQKLMLETCEEEARKIANFS